MSEQDKAELKLDSTGTSQEDVVEDLTTTQGTILDDPNANQTSDIRDAGNGKDQGEHIEASSIPTADGAQHAASGGAEVAGAKPQPRESNVGSLPNEPGAYRITPRRPESPDSLTDERDDDPLPEGATSTAEATLTSEPPPSQDSLEPCVLVESNSGTAPVVLQAVVVTNDPESGFSGRSRSGSDKALLVEARPDYPSRRRLWLTLFWLLTLGAVVGISVGVTQSRSSSNRNSTKPPPSVAPTPLPTLSPTSIAIMQEFLSGLPQTTQAEIKSNPSSPQAKALSWLSSPDHPEITDIGRLAERFALATLFYATEGESWLRNDGWLNETMSECDWFGCTCSTLNDTLQSLLIDDNNLNGTIPSELGFLTGLDNLGLYSNHLRGTLPTEIGLLTLMLNLFISENEEISGPLPVELANLESLSTLILHNCAFTGTIPTQLGTLTNLVWLALSNNTLRSTIPTELGLLTVLDSLYIDGNLLEGPIPSEIAALPLLFELNLRNNSLSGRIPTDWAAVDFLTYVYLEKNNLTGSVPSNLGNFRFLEELDLRQNEIMGTMPESLCDLVDSGILKIQVDCPDVTCDCCLCG